jgi:uncharacterized protein (TIGR03437 family)
MAYIFVGVARPVRKELSGRSKSAAWLISCLLAGSMCYAQSSGGISTITVVGKSATQAVLSYTAPDNNACRVEVSESSSYAPLVHDVDPALFAGSDSDQRSGSVISGTKRTVVVGKRISETALDNKIYSRALQARTPHYARITCGSSVATATFTTSNIPFGTTYMDLPPVNSPTLQPGVPMVDEQTGALVKIAAPASNHYYSLIPSLGSSGQYQVCSPEVVGPDNGYLCAFLTATGGGAGAAYYYVPSSGEMRYLGSYITTSSPGTDGWDGHVIGYPQPGRVTYNDVPTHSGKVALLKGTYSGTYQAAPPASVIPMTWTQVYIDGGDLATALRNFNPAITATSCGALAVEGNWLLVDCRSGIQDTYPFAIGVVDLNTGRAIAARNMMTQSPTRFCGEHNFHFMVSGAGIPIIELIFHGLTAGGQTVGGGPYTVTLATDVSAGQTTITVSGEPQARTDDLPMQARPGDYFMSPTTHEYFKIISKISSTQWQVQRAAIAGTYWQAGTYHAGDTLSADCGVPGTGGGWTDTYWRFQADPFGNNLVLNQAWQGGAHDDAGPNLHLTEGYGFSVGPIDTLLDKGQQFTITADPTFAGVGSRTDGNTTAMHPAFRQVSDPNWFTDSRPFNGGSLQSDIHTRVSGSLIKYTFPAWFSDSGIHPKVLPTLSFTQGMPLKDLSRPGSFISDGPDMPYTYCRALIDGECRPTAKAGDLFANIPDLQLLYCAGSDGPNTAFHDWCALDSPALGQSLLQLGIAPNRVGVKPDQPASVYGLGWSRALSRGFGSIRSIGQLAKATPDGKWLLFNQRINNTEGPLLMLKIPPFQAEDSVDRSTFIPAIVTVAPNSQAASAVIQFGYAEQGAPGQYYCTSRQESCVAISSSINPADPFKYKDTEHYSGVPCQAGCQIAIPLAPQHVAYYQVLYLDASGHVIALGSQGVVTEQASSSAPPPPSGISVTVNPSLANLGPSQTSQFTATVSNSSNTAVTWSLSPLLGSLSNGLYTAPATITSSQSVTVSATSLADPTKTATAMVQLSPSASLAISPLNATLPAASKLQFLATVNGIPGASVQWTMNPAVGALTYTGLYETPASVTSPQTLTVTASVPSNDGSWISASATVTLTPAAGGPQITMPPINSASLAGGPVSPGEIVTIKGTGIGPADHAAMEVGQSGLVTTTLGGVRVLFDGEPAPLIYAQSTQVNLVAPYSLADQATTKVEIEYQGQRSGSLTLAIVPSAPGVFTLDATGQGQGAILNQDGTVNSVDNPAPRGSIVSIYGTGGGQTNPQGIDGKLADIPPSVLLLPVTVTMGGIGAEVLYNGAAPTLVEGVLLINARIPDDVFSGNAIPILARIGDSFSQLNVTLAVR